MPNYRIQRLAERIKEELSDILQRELKDPRLGFVSITDVELTRDLQVAKVYVSVLGSEEEKATSLETLQRAKGFLRTE
nr:30S ribosome-binding factor RbfA [Bacillota bacterium]